MYIQGLFIADLHAGGLLAGGLWEILNLYVIFKAVPTKIPIVFFSEIETKS